VDCHKAMGRGWGSGSSLGIDIGVWGLLKCYGCEWCGDIFWGLIQCYEERVGHCNLFRDWSRAMPREPCSRISLLIDTELWGESQTVGLVWGLIKYFGERVRQWN